MNKVDRVLEELRECRDNAEERMEKYAYAEKRELSLRWTMAYTSYCYAIGIVEKGLLKDE